MPQDADGHGHVRAATQPALTTLTELNPNPNPSPNPNPNPNPTQTITITKVRFYREVELKHGRVGMLAAVGFLVGEQFHPLFNVDAPSYLAFQQTPLQAHPAP